MTRNVHKDYCIADIYYLTRVIALQQYTKKLGLIPSWTSMWPGTNHPGLPLPSSAPARQQ